MFLFVFVRLEFFPLPFILVDFLRSHTSLSLFFFRSLHLQKMHLSIHIFIFVVGAVGGAVVVLSIYLFVSVGFRFALVLYAILFYNSLYFSKCFMCLPCTKRVCTTLSVSISIPFLFLSLFNEYVLSAGSSHHNFAHVHCYYRYYWFAVFIIICCYLLWPMNKNGFRNIVCFCTRYFLFYLRIYFFSIYKLILSQINITKTQIETIFNQSGLKLIRKNCFRYGEIIRTQKNKNFSFFLSKVILGEYIDLSVYKMIFQCKHC